MVDCDSNPLKVRCQIAIGIRRVATGLSRARLYAECVMSAVLMCGWHHSRRNWALDVLSGV